MGAIRNALLSVHDKTGLVRFASGLHRRGVRLLATEGTAAALSAAGLPVRTVAEYTGQAELLGGRVKSLHPRIFAALLARRTDPAQMGELERQGIDPIDLVAVNLYPFEAAVAGPSCSLEDALRHIDVGGVSLLRAAVKNFPDVVVVCDPRDYDEVLGALDADRIPMGRRLQWAQRAVAHTAAYEAAICAYLSAVAPEAVELDRPVHRVRLPAVLPLSLRRLRPLRYGENPHQSAALYAADGKAGGLAAARQLHGRELSYNNLLDLDAAWRLASALPPPAAAVVKHGTPCGAAAGRKLAEAYRQARATDPISAFGGIVGLNEAVDRATAVELAGTFLEAVVAPGYEPEALAVLTAKRGLRLLEAPSGEQAPALEVRSVAGGFLVQEPDPGGAARWRCVTAREPSAAEQEGLRFAWAVIPFVRSNGVVVARGRRLLGVGAGQMSRVDACRFAVWKAREAGHELAGSVAASDAFFPFPDGIEVLAQAGVTAVVQPGGSIRDREVIEAADRLGLAMIFTGTRHFRH